nr:hypothetical protein [Methylobacterium sp. E-005]
MARRLEWTPWNARCHVGRQGAARLRAGAGVGLRPTIGLDVLALKRPPRHAGGHVGRSGTARLRAGSTLWSRTVGGLHILALKIMALKILALKILALQILTGRRPFRCSRRRVGRCGTAGLAACRARARLRTAIALVLGALIEPTRAALRGGRAIRIGGAAVTLGCLWRRCGWPFAAWPGLGTGTTVPVRSGSIELTILAVGLTILSIGTGIRRPLSLTLRPLLLTVGPGIRTCIRPFLVRRTRCLRFGAALGRALPLRRLGLALGRGFRTLPRRWCGPFRARLRPLAARRRPGGRARPFLRWVFRPRAAMRRLATPGPTVFRAALRQQDPPWRRVGWLKGHQRRQNSAGQEKQSQ